MLPSSTTKINIEYINKRLKDSRFRDNFSLTNHQEIMSNDFWVDGIQLSNLDKTRLAKIFGNDDYLSKKLIFREFYSVYLKYIITH